MQDTELGRGYGKPEAKEVKEVEEAKEIREAERKGRIAPVAQNAQGKWDLRGRRDPSQKTFRVKWNC